MNLPSPETSPTMALAQTVLGGALFGSPWWVPLVSEINLLLGTVAALCGAVIGIVGVYRLVTKEPAE